MITKNNNLDLLISLIRNYPHPERLLSTIASIVIAISILLKISPALANLPINYTPIQASIISLTGTIKQLAIEGNCYQLTTNDGKKYELIGKFPKFDGVKVQVRGTVAIDIVTICQVGQPLKVKSIRVLKPN